MCYPASPPFVIRFDGSSGTIDVGHRWSIRSAGGPGRQDRTRAAPLGDQPSTIGADPQSTFFSNPGVSVTR